MEDLEKQLQSALQREDAPEWFEARVMNAVSAQRAERARPRWHWILATAMAGVIAMGAGWEHQRDGAGARRG